MRNPKESSRATENLGPIPDHIEPEDTEPTLFETPDALSARNDVTPVVCSLCRRSPFDSDDAFERGIDYALVRIHGLCNRYMSPGEAQGIVDTLRERIKNP